MEIRAKVTHIDLANQKIHLLVSETTDKGNPYMREKEVYYMIEIWPKVFACIDNIFAKQECIFVLNGSVLVDMCPLPKE